MRQPLYTGISLAIILFILLSFTSRAATYYSIATGPWTTSSSWSLSSGGSPIVSGYPGAGDDVVIEGGFTISIAVSSSENLSAANIYIGSSTSGTLFFPANHGNSTLTVSGDIIIGGNNGSVTGALNYNSWGLTITCSRLLKGAGTVSRTNPLQQDLTFTGTFTLAPEFNQFRNFIINSGTVILSANIETNGSTSPYIETGSTLDLQTYVMTIGGYENFVINGTLIVGGNSGGFEESNFPNTFSNLTIGNNSTVIYSYPGDQSIYPAIYNNLVLRGAGTKTIVPVGYIESISITNSGSGYTCDPAVIISGGGGSGADAEAYTYNNELDFIDVRDGGSGYTSAPTISFSGCNGTGGTAEANMVILPTATVNGTLTIGASATLSPSPALIFGPGSNTVLPVKMSPVTAFEQRGGIQLTWITYSEENVRSFDIEKSTDGFQFRKAGSVIARGANNITTAYKWLDANAVAGNNYYRVKSIDIDDRAEYSQIASIFLGQGTPALSVYPNPVYGSSISLKLVNIEAGTYIVTITNQQGQSIYNKNITHAGGSASYTIQPENCFITGSYQLQFRNEKICETRMILKK